MCIRDSIWTEHISSIKSLDFMVFPRIAAIAETAWSDKDDRSYERSVSYTHLTELSTQPLMATITFFFSSVIVFFLYKLRW